MSLLTVDKLGVTYPGAARPVLERLSFTVHRGESVGLIGESGSGKTQTALALMGLLPPNAAASGSVRFDDTELLGAAAAVLNRVRACRMAMVFQDPATALNPYLCIGEQLQRIVVAHRLAPRRDAPARALSFLRRVGLPDPARQMQAYPHQLSGGQRQRVMIAAALIGEPDLLIADEPTTALDVTVQAQLLDLLMSLRRQFDAALLLITHDLGVIAGNTDRLLVLERGRLVDEGATDERFRAPGHDATRRMVAAAPGLADIADVEPLAGADGTVLSANGVHVSYFEKPFAAVWRRREVRAVRDVSLALRRGETLALVGESGSGKTSLARALLGLLPMTRGALTFLGQPLDAPVERRAHDLRRRLQLVFQDPVGSLNPSMRVAGIVAEPLKIHDVGLHASERRAAVDDILKRVGLSPDLRRRFPHELSGGQAQRVAIARALILGPAVLICDEALSALDGTVRDDILGLLAREQRATGLSILFISHDLGIVKRISHRIAVMYMGRVCEVATASSMFRRPRHPYTRALIDAVPVPDPAAPRRPPEASGEVASLLDPPPGCAFHPRCRYAVDRCRTDAPVLAGRGGRQAACHRAGELDLRDAAATPAGSGKQPPG